MIDLRPDIAARHVRFMALAATGLGLRCCLPGLAPIWPLLEGYNLLLRWSGERLPLPSLEPAGRSCEIVGYAEVADGEVYTFADVTHAADTIYHYGLVQVSGGGVVNVIRPLEVITRTFDDVPAVRGLMPNAPSCLAVWVLAGDLPHVSWIYSAARQQVAPTQFRVYVTDGETGFNFASAAGTVSYTVGQTRYSWTGTALSPGDARHYTVRAESSDSVLSLIPRSGLCPSGDYDSVELGRCPMVIVPAGPAAPIDELWVGGPG